MKSKKLLRFTIMDALEVVLSKNGITTPSKKTRKTIIKASERLSNLVQKDLMTTHKAHKIKKPTMSRPPLVSQWLEEAVNDPA